MMLLNCYIQYVSKFEKSAVATVFIPILKKGNAKEYSNYYTVVFISHGSEVMLKIFQAKLQQYVNQPRTTRCSSWVQKKQRYQRSNCQHSLDHGERKGIPENLYFCFIDYVKDFDCVDYNRKIFKEMEIPDLLTYCLRNLRVKNQQLELDMKQWIDSKLGEDYDKAVFYHCLFNLCVKYKMQKVRLDESQNGIKIAGRNINNVRYADDTSLVAKSEKELETLLMWVKKESGKADLKLNIKKLRLWQVVLSLHGK